MRRVYVFNETEENLKQEMKLAKKIAKYALKIENAHNYECNIIFVDNKRIHQINQQYRNVDRETDVISFALEDNQTFEMKIRVLGDIYISIEKARQQALEYQHSNKREIAFLTVHGVLHLLGYDHMTKEEETVMFQRQEEVLTHYGIKR